jgi:hypothetical protein
MAWMMLGGSVAVAVLSATGGGTPGGHAAGVGAAGLGGCAVHGRAGALVLAAGAGERAGACASEGGGFRLRSGAVIGCGMVARGERGTQVVPEALPEPVRAMIEARLARAAAGLEVPATCFAPGTPAEIVEAFNARFFPPDAGDFQNADRWISTSAGLAPPLGEPVTVRWSIVPDGTPIDGFNGEPAAASNLRAFLNGIYGSEAAWLPLFQQVMDRWSQVSGIRYVLEPNDDGAALATMGGQAGVRGDVRIGGHPIDGAGGVLAYNFFPDNGDMVIDTADTFYNSTGNNSLRLRNVVAHELGHGLGMSHVCPTEQTKLMEPSVSEAFDGPRHDDIRHAHFLYGDPAEPDNTAGTAVNLGAIAACETRTIGAPPEPAGFFGNLFYGSLRSLDASGEQDWVRFTIDTPRRLSATVSPEGWPYDDSPQNSDGSCGSGSLIDSLPGTDLSLALIGSNGVTVLSSANATGAGSGESLAGVLLMPGTYFLRVSEVGGGTGQFPQLYTLSLSAAPAAVDVGVVNSADVVVAPGQPASIDVTLGSAGEPLDAGASVIRYSLNGGPTVTAPLSAQGGGVFRASIPLLQCGDALTWRLEARSSSGSVVNLPCGGGDFAPVVGTRVTVLSDDFETDQGWTTGPNTATAGNWLRGDPVGTAAQPEYDNTPGAGTLCWFTGQAVRGQLIGAADLDGGVTRLVSPVLNLLPYSQVTVNYARWFSNGYGAGPYNDRFRVELSLNNGSTWTTVQTIGPGSGSDPETNGLWLNASVSFAAPSTTARIRFVAEDVNPQSLVEAAVDDVVIIGRSCAFTPAPSCPADYNGDSWVNLDDLGDFITDYYAVPAIPGGAQAAAPTYPGEVVGFGGPCPEAPDAGSPYALDAYRVNGYRVGYSPDGSNACPLSPDQPFPNLDNLNDYITLYYSVTGCP